MQGEGGGTGALGLIYGGGKMQRQHDDLGEEIEIEKVGRGRV